LDKSATAERVSAHETVNRMSERVRAQGLTNVADRYAAQGNRCSFCEMGVSCQLCSNGPCRISKKADRGVCGIDADGMAMRNMLHRNIMGIAAYTYHARDAAETLKATAEGRTPFTIKDKEKLSLLARDLRVHSTNPAQKAINTADTILTSINQSSSEESLMVDVFAPASRKDIWRKLDILPGGPAHEIIDATARAMTNIDGDYVSLAKAALRLGIASCYGALVPLELVQDILFGTPSPHQAQVDLGVIDPDYVNIVPNGHEPFVGAALIDLARGDDVQQLAKEAGAKGLKIIGSIETGQELMQRYPCDEVFAGLTGNWLNQEYAIATGGIDLFVMDMNCSIPSLKQVADEYGTKLVAVSKLVGIPGVDEHIDYQPERVREQAQELVEMAIESFKKRQGKEAVRGLKTTKIVTGFCTESVLEALGGTLDPLLDVIKDGTLKGIVALVSCTTLRNGGQDVVTTKVAQELIARDILVLSAGCGNAATQVSGLNSLEAQSLAGPGLKAVCEKLHIPPVLSFGTCTDVGRLVLLVTAVADALGVDPSQLPVAVTAPEYMEQKATIDAFGAVAFGLYTHVSPLPPVGGAPRVVKLLTEDVESLVGGKLAVEEDPVEAVNGIEKHINSKREALGI
jgi:carbon-monoxide dehydrogenase catalytic subunit